MADLMMLQAPVGLAFFGADSRFLRVNAALVRLGIAPDGSASRRRRRPIRLAGLLP